MLRLFFAASVLLFAAVGSHARESAEKKKAEAMDYGPTLGCSLEINGELVLRALIVRLNKEKKVYACYDLETMRLAAVWSGGFINFNGVIFDAEHHCQPKPQGTFLFANKVGPGWARDGSFSDPRPEFKVTYNAPKGGVMTREGQPMPAEWIKLNGHYLNGERVVLSYRINGVKVLENLLLNEADGKWGVVRQIAIEPSEKEQKLFVASADVPSAISQAEGVSLADGIVTLAPSKEARSFSIQVGSAAAPAKTEDLNALTKGGSPRWAETLATQGSLGGDEGPYAVDTITAPETNPWNSWLRFGGFDFFPDNKSAALSTWNGDVWIVKGIDEKLGTLTWKRFATGLHEPLGLKIVDGTIYLTCRNQLTRLHDLNNDGEADYYENFNSDMHLTRHFHEFALDLKTDAAGNFYFAKGATPGRGGPNFDLWSIHNSCFFRVSKDGSKLDVVARGLRAPNGIGVGPNGELTSGDNEGSWVPACPINRIREGGFVGIPDGVPGEVKPTKRDNPILWIPHKYDNSGGDQSWVPDERWGPFKGHMLHLSYGRLSLFHVMTQQVGDELQGAIARFPVNFLSGTMRSRFNAADGQLYICGLKGWQTAATRDGAFQRVRYTGKPVHMPYAFNVTKQGLEITFTNTLDKAAAEDLQNYSVEQFNLIWSKKYGSPEMSVANPDRTGHDPVEVKSIKLKEDGKTVVLEIPGIKPVMCMIVGIKIKAADGSAINTMINNTINAVP
jgi:hypothetical protein